MKFKFGLTFARKGLSIALLNILSSCSLMVVAFDLLPLSVGTC